jgi:hypothetical protein
MKKFVLTAIAAMAIFFAGTVFAQRKPPVDVSGKKHPNILAAQRLSREAFDKVVLAQKANEFDLEGHAQKAKDLLDNANKELKFAAEAANKDK